MARKRSIFAETRQAMTFLAYRSTIAQGYCCSWTYVLHLSLVCLPPILSRVSTFLVYIHDHIDVFETEGKGKNRTRRIVIYYRFVGYIEWPAPTFRPNYKADTRKGIAVKYLT